MATSSRNGYSAEVRLWLRLNGRIVPLAQVGPDEVELTEAECLPPGPAELVLSVDTRERRWPIEVGHQQSGSLTVPIRLVGG